MEGGALGLATDASLLVDAGLLTTPPSCLRGCPLDPTSRALAHTHVPLEALRTPMLGFPFVRQRLVSLLQCARKDERGDRRALRVRRGLHADRAAEYHDRGLRGERHEARAARPQRHGARAAEGLPLGCPLGLVASAPSLIGMGRGFLALCNASLLQARPTTPQEGGGGVAERLDNFLGTRLSKVERTYIVSRSHSGERARCIGPPKSGAGFDRVWLNVVDSVQSWPKLAVLGRPSDRKCFMLA